MSGRVTSKTFWALILLGLILQGSALWLRGTSDVRAFKTWALTALDRNPMYAYSAVLPVPATSESAIPDYPPLTLYLLSAAGAVARHVDPSVDVESRQLATIVKIPALLIRLLLLGVVVFVAFRLTGDIHQARFAGLAYWLNPAFILNGPTLGYLDPLCWAPGILAVLAAGRGWVGTAGSLVALSLLIKPQGLFFVLPVVAVLGWKKAIRAGFSMTLVFGLTVLPFLILTPTGFLHAMLVNFREDLLSGDALNFWWIVGSLGLLYQNGLAALEQPAIAMPLSLFTAELGFNVRPIVTAVVLASAGVALWLVRRRRDDLAGLALGALVLHIYFSFALAVHENHLVYALPFLGLAALADRRYLTMYVLVSAFVAVNLLLMYGIGRDFASPTRSGVFLPVSVGLSAAGLGLLGWHVRLFLSVARGPSGTRTNRVAGYGADA